MGDPGTQVTGRIQGVACQAAQGHTNGDDDAEDQEFAHTGVQTGNLVHTADGEHQHEGSNGFLHNVPAGIGNGGAGGEDAQLGARVLGGVELILKENIHQDTTGDTAQDLSNDIAGNQSPVKHAAHSQGNGQRGIEAGAGGLAEDKSGKHNSKTPGNGDLDRAGALHAGFVEADVGDNAVAQKDQDHGAQKLSNIR